MDSLLDTFVEYSKMFFEINPDASRTVFRSKIEITLSEDFCNLFSYQHY